MTTIKTAAGTIKTATTQTATTTTSNLGTSTPWPGRRVRRGLSTALACLLALGTTLPATAQGVTEGEPAQLLTVVGGWEKGESLASAAAVEGLAVEIRSDLLARGQQRLRFQDFTGRVFDAELDRIERPTAGATVWHGQVREYGEHSQVLLATYEDAVSGYLDTPDGRYEIAPRPGGHVLMKIDSSRFGGCGTEDHEEHDHPVSDAVFDRAALSLGVDPAAVRQQADKAGAEPSSSNKSLAQIEIAVLTTEASTVASGGPFGALATALSSISALNSAFSASGVQATAVYKGWTMVSADDLGDSFGGGDGLVNVIYGNGSGLHKDNDQQWHQALADLGDSAYRDDTFGEVLAVGDFDGDGSDDLAIGVPREDINGTNNVGAVQIVYGSTSRLTTAGNDFFHQDSPGVTGSNQIDDLFGFSLATGDFDGDGYDDLAIGRPYEDLGDDVDTGRVQVMYGSPGGISTAGETTIDQGKSGMADSNEVGDLFGYALAAGDFDGDGYDDLAIGVSDEDLGSIVDAGRVAVVYGSGAGLDTLDSQSWHQDSSGIQDTAETGDRLGQALTVGDFDGDGYDDLAIGVPLEDVGSTADAGLVHTLFGSPSGLTSAGSQAFDQNSVSGNSEASDYFGSSLAVGDFDGDGTDDLAASAPFENWNNVGRTHVLLGSSSGLAAGFVVTGSSTGGQLGQGIAAGDFDGDGYDDLALGAPWADDDGDPSDPYDDVESSGEVVIYHGSPSGMTRGDTWSQSSSGIGGSIEDFDGFGFALAAGDFDGDGDADLAVGVPGEGVSNDTKYFKKWLGSSSLTTTFRASTSADLVGLIVEHLDGSCGSAQTVLDDTAGDSSKFYQVTGRHCAVSNLTFAHEIGHLLGLGHDPANGSGACSDAHGHYVSGLARTMMSYSNQCTGYNCDRVAVISNPFVHFVLGIPSGIYGERNNARCANLSVGNVAAYN